MNTLRLLAAALVTLAIGCVTQPETTFAPTDVGTEVGASGQVTVRPAGTSVHDLQRPDSGLADGAHVVLAHGALRVTAQSDHSLWVQEADATGLCDDGSADRVAFRAIRVEALTLDHRFVPGEQIRVEGDVMTIDGRRRIVRARVTSLGLAAPYRAHCDREGTDFWAPELEAVLVETAGRSLGELPGGAGAWGLRSCFAPDAGAVRIERSMEPGEPADGAWRWVTGVVQQRWDDAVIQPRNGDDLIVGGSDVCL